MQKLLVVTIFVGSVFSVSPSYAFNWWKPKPPSEDYGKQGEVITNHSESSETLSGDSASSLRKHTVNKREDGGGSGAGDGTENSGSGEAQSPLIKKFGTSWGKNSNPSSIHGKAIYQPHNASFACAGLSKICAEAPKNCERVKKEISNGDALDYTLQYLSDNYERMQDTSCASGSTHGNNLSKGFSNASNGKGKFILNDTETILDNGRAQAHYVDLCGGEYLTYGVKMGTGETFLDKEKKRSTLLGAFMTSQIKEPFTPMEKSKPGYIKAGLLDPKQVELVGLNSSNAETDESKPMHESPFNTSWGCPAVDRSELNLLDKIKGGHLVMNYRSGYMQRLGPNASCQNGNGSGSGYTSRSSIQPGGTQ